MQRSDGNGGSDATEGSGSFSVDRRSYLKLAGVAAGSVPMLSGAASAAFTRRGLRFERSIDMVRDAGCDPTGNEPCDQQIRDAADSFTLLRFPPGEYLITEKNVILDETNVGFLGEGDVRFTVPKNYNEKMLVVDRGTGVLFENIDVDLRAAGATPGLLFGADDDLEVHDVEYIGQGIHPDSDPRGQGNGNPAVTYAFYPIIRSPDGTGTVSNVVAKNDGLMGAYNGGNGRVGVWIGLSHKGAVTLEGCRFEGFPNNGLYCSRTGGAVQVEGGVFRNNDITQVRLSNTDSHVKDAVISADFDNSDSPNPGDTLNSRGVRFEAGRFGYGGATVENCDIAIISTPNSSGGVVVGSDGADHSALNTRIRIEEDSIRGFYAKAPTGYGSRDPPPKPHDAELRDVSITGGANNTSAIRIDQRDDSVVSGCCVSQTGADRDGVVVSDSNGGVVKDSTIDVVGRTVVEDNSHVSTSGISTSGSCPVANYGAGDSLPRRLVLEGGDGRFDYRFFVSGDLGKSTARDATIDPNDSISGGTASGQGGSGGVDSYGFSGELVLFEMSGDATVYLDGNEVDPSELPSELSIQGTGPYTEYAFSVSEGLAEYRGIGGEDSISGSSATGAVGSGRDSYGFSGRITELSLSNDADIYAAGKKLDLSELLPNTLTIQGSGSYTSYEFAADGGIAPNYGITGSDSIDVEGGRASGAVSSGDDSYRFSGKITDISISNETKLFLNGNRTDITELLPNVLVIDGNGPRCDYTFSVSGGLAPKHGIGDEDDIDIEASSATGAVGSGRDVYAFGGEITDIELDGIADVSVNGERLDVGSGRTLTIASNGGRFSYRFSVSGNLGKSTTMGASIDDNDTISGRTATGQGGGGGLDSYTFSGEVTDMSLNGDATVYLDETEVGAEEFLPSVLTVNGLGSYTSYEFAADGGIAPNYGITGSDSIDVEGGRASGAVSSGDDSYRFSGDIGHLSLRSHAKIDVDRSAGTISVSGTGKYASYQLTVTGRFRSGSGISGSDKISGGRASGAVSSSTDTYRYTGNLTEVTVDDHVSVTVSR